MENGLKNSRAQMDRFLREYDGLHQRTIQLTDDLDNQMHTNQLLANDLNERESEIFRKRSESEQVLREDRRIEKLGKLTDKKVHPNPSQTHTHNLTHPSPPHPTGRQTGGGEGGDR